MFGSLNDRQDSLVMAINNNMSYAVNGVIQLKAGNRRMETFDQVGNIKVNGAELIVEDNNGRRLVKQHLNKSVIINGISAQDYGFTDTPGLIPQGCLTKGVANMNADEVLMELRDKKMNGWVNWQDYGNRTMTDFDYRDLADDLWGLETSLGLRDKETYKFMDNPKIYSITGVDGEIAISYDRQEDDSFSLRID